MKMFVLQEETLIFLYACLLGVALAACYDGLRLLRVLIPHHRFLVSVEDFLFFVVAGVITFGFFLSYTDGGLRVFILAGELLGAICYFFSASLLLLRLLRPVMLFFRRVFRWAFRPFLRLGSKIKRLFCFLAGKSGKTAKKFARNVQLHLKNRKRVVYNKSVVLRRNSGKHKQSAMENRNESGT